MSGDIPFFGTLLQHTQTLTSGADDAAFGEDLSDMEKDALGEIGNISMGTAATALSQILNHKVAITAPRVQITTPADLFRSFEVPYAIVTIEYTSGLAGNNLLIIRVSDAAVIADLMMGGDGRQPGELGEIGLSALAEAMNQMIGAAATSMSLMFQRSVAISPPKVAIFRTPADAREFYPWDPDEKVAVVSFRMTVQDLVESELLQVVPVAVAKQEVGLLLQQAGTGPDGAAEPGPKAAGAYLEAEPTMSAPGLQPAGEQLPARGEATGTPQPRTLDLLLDVPLEVSAVIGRTRRPIKEVLTLVPGSVVELDRAVEKPVEILVNGTLVAEGEVVVVDENFGVRITRIISPADRLKHLR